MPTTDTTIARRRQPNRRRGHSRGHVPANQVDPKGKTGAADTSAPAGLEEGRTTVTGATAAHTVGKPGTPREVAPVATITRAAGEPNTHLGAVPATEGAGPATTTNGAGEQGSALATTYGTRGMDFATPGAAPTTRRARPAKSEAVHTFPDAVVTPRTQLSGTAAPTRTPGERARFVANTPHPSVGEPTERTYITCLTPRSG